jgi:heme exporter protein A
MGTFSGHDLTCIRGERLVFRGLSFAVTAGGALALRGPNGAGKSTLLRLCAGFIAPAQGKLAWDGADVSADDEAWRARLAYVGHADPIKAGLTLRDNLAFWAALGGGGAVGAALDAFGLSALADTPGRFLSAGQKRRANLARLLVQKATLWLLDEPTTALDSASVARLADAVAAHRAGGGMVMAATHIDLGFGADVLEFGR